MTTKKCDKCGNIIDEDKPFLFGEFSRGTVNDIDNGNHIELIHEDQDFCSVLCVSQFLTKGINKDNK
jgi:hypothetical protein